MPESRFLIKAQIFLKPNFKIYQADFGIRPKKSWGLNQNPFPEIRSELYSAPILKSLCKKIENVGE